MKFLDDKDVFIVNGTLDFAGAKFGIDGDVEVICPTCFINKMFADTGNLEALIEIVDEHEDEIIEEDKGGFVNDDYDWETDAVEVFNENENEEEFE